MTVRGDFNDFVGDRLEAKREVFENNPSVRNWRNQLKQCYGRLLDDEKLLELLRAINETEKELSYYIGFIDGLQLKESIYTE